MTKEKVIELADAKGAIPTSDSVELAPEEVPASESKKEDGNAEVLMEAARCQNDSQWWSSYAEDEGYVHRCTLDNFVQKELGRECNPNNLGLEEFAKTGLPSSYADKPENKGRNQLTEPEGESTCHALWRNMTGEFSLLLWTGSILCFVAYGIQQATNDSDMSNLFLGAVLAIVVFLTGLYTFFQERDSDNVMAEFAALKPADVDVLRDGNRVQLSPDDLLVGDIIFLEAGDLIAADIRVIKTTNLKVEQSSLTGEPDAIKKDPTKNHENPLESKNLIFYGTSCTEGEGYGIVTMIGDDTIMGNIARMASDDGEENPSPINKEIKRFIHIVSAVAIFLGITFCVIGLIMDHSWPAGITSNLVFMIGIIVANVPEGLLATVTVSLTLTARKLQQKQVKVKDLEGVETLGSTTVICSDKTGTLTQNKMTASFLYLEMENKPASFPERNDLYNIREMTSANESDANPKFEDIKDPALTYCLYAANCSQTAVFKRFPLVNADGQVGDGVKNMKLCIQERQCTAGNASDFGYVKWCEAVLRKQGGAKIEDAKTPPLTEQQRAENPKIFSTLNGVDVLPVSIPFNSKYKFMCGVYMVQDAMDKNRIRPCVLMKGAAEQIFQRSSHYLKGKNVEKIDAKKALDFNRVYEKLADDGERLIGFCMKFLDEMPQGCEYDPKPNFPDAKAGGPIGGLIKTPITNGKKEPLNTDGDPDSANYPLGNEHFTLWKNRDGTPGSVSEGAMVPPNPAWDGMVFIGIVSMVDPPREAVPSSILQCHSAGVKVVMVTGDHPATAEAIARNVNIIRRGSETARSYYKKCIAGPEAFAPGDDLEYTDYKSDEFGSPSTWNEKTDPRFKELWAEEATNFKGMVLYRKNADDPGQWVSKPKAMADGTLDIADADPAKDYLATLTPLTTDELVEDNESENAAKRIVRSHLTAKVVPGWELKKMSDFEVQKAFMYRDLVFARTSPEQKQGIVLNAQAMGHVVAVTGDGVNDSPAIKAADIGCAMSIAGTEVTKKVADLELLTDDFSAIVMGIEEGRVIFDNLKKSIAYTLSSNIPEISPFLMFIVFAFPLSLTTVLILCVDLGTDMIPAISLAYERKESDIMSRPPRDSNVDHLVTAKLVSFSYLQIGVFQALAGFYSFFVVCNDYGFDIFDVPGSAHYVGIIGTKPIFVYGGNQMNEKNDAGKISSFCPCGGEDGGAEISLNYADNMKYAVPIRNGQLDTSSSRYSNLIEHIKDTEKGVNTDAEAEAKINKYCPAYTNGNSKLPGGDVKLDESLGDDGKNWPYTWGCRFGAIEPTRECKFPDFKPKTGKNPCYKSSQAIPHGQTAAFISIVIVQWADLVICKTRLLSMYHQGMNNNFMILGLFSETVLCAFLAYATPLHQAIGTRDVQFVHWLPSCPYSILIFLYDETRKYIIRQGRKTAYMDPPFNKIANPNYKEGFLEKYTFY